jgi:cytochrome c
LDNVLPQGVLILTSVLLLIAAGIVTAVGLLRSGERDPALEPVALTGGDPERGERALARHGCAACHRIPGIPEAGGLIGPPLDHFASRIYVGGVLPNTPENLVAWILDPRGIDPMTAMPATGISEAEARDATAYLYTLP